MSKALAVIPAHVAEEKAHADLGASTAARWMACAGSLNLIKTVPLPLPTVFAAEGTAAHHVAEMCLQTNADPDSFIGKTVHVEDGKFDITITDDMAESIGVYVDYCRELIARCARHWIELSFDLSAFKPPAPMFGTGDCVAYDAVIYEVEVADLKFGRGVKVEVFGNKQLRYYALGAAVELINEGLRVDSVKVTIIQPRAEHPDGVIRSETFRLSELLEFGAELMQKAHATQDPNAPLVVGPHCRFCPAAAVCPEQQKHTELVMQSEFSVLAEDTPPAPETLPDAVFEDILSKAPILENWLKQLYAEATRRLERGGTLPGFKLVARRATRKWKDEDQTAKIFRESGYADEEIFDLKLKSPRRIEKLTGKKLFPTELAHKVSSGYVMVPIADPRPAIAVSAADEFTALESGDHRQDEEEKA